MHVNLLLEITMHWWLLVFLPLSCQGLPEHELLELELDYGLAEPQRTSLLQSSLILQFSQDYKHIPRITYFTCQKPHLQTPNQIPNAAEHRDAFAAKNFQLIKSLYESELFVRIVLLDVLAQSPSSGRPNRPGSGPTGGFSQTPSQAQSNSEWLEGVLRMEALRQIAVVDLACGAVSRRFLELVRRGMDTGKTGRSFSTRHWKKLSNAFEFIEIHIMKGAIILCPLIRLYT